MALSAQDILDDPTASYWLKTALREALRRDPVDAEIDALMLAQVLSGRSASVARTFERTRLACKNSLAV